MKLKKIAVAAALGAASSFAMAGGFDGPFVQLGIGGSSTSTKLSGTDSGLDGTNSSGSFNGLVAAGYSQSIGEEGFNLAANIFYVIGNQNSGNRTATSSNSYGSVNENVNQKAQNTFGIFVEPGWNFTKETLGYAKLGWVNTTGKANAGWSYTDNRNAAYNESGTNDFSKNINGFGYGLGVKQKITENLFAAVDLIGVTYGSTNYTDGVSAKPSQFLGFASIGYKF